MLWMQVFELESSVTTLEKVVDQLLMRGDLPIVLGASSASWLMDRFLMHTFSVTSFLRGLKFVAIEHFSHNRLAALCTSLSSDGIIGAERKVDALCDALGYDDLRHILDLKSVKAELEMDGAAGTSSRQNVDMEDLRKRVKEWLIDFQREKVACH